MEQEIADQLRKNELGRTVVVKSSASHADVLAMRRTNEDRMVLTYLARTGDEEPKQVLAVIPDDTPGRYDYYRQLASSGQIEHLKVHFLGKTDPVC